MISSKNWWKNDINHYGTEDVYSNVIDGLFFFLKLTSITKD